MPEEGGRGILRTVIPILVVAVLIGAFAMMFLRAQSRPEGVVEVIWDEEACAHCLMHIGEPGFAAQLQTEAGDVFNFDDPGCLFLYVEEHSPDIHAVFFHHVREARWMPAEGAAFISVAHSPMGFGIGAVEAGEQGTLTYEQGRQVVLEQGGLTGRTEE